MFKHKDLEAATRTAAIHTIQKSGNSSWHVLRKAISCIVFQPPLATKEWPWNTSLPRDKEPTQPVPGLLPCVGIYFPVSGSMCTTLFCLSVCVNSPQAHPEILVFQTPCGRDQVHSAVAQRSACRLIAPTGRGGQTSSIGTELALSLFYVNPMLDCVVFSLVTLTPRCSGQKSLDFYSWWLALWRALLSSM